MSWLAKVRRRNAGIYLFRTDKPRGWGRHNAYVGESVHIHLRGREHTHGGGRYNATAKPWSDLNPRQHHLITLPWWASWKWVLRPLEWLAIKTLLPVYNDKHNRTNPRRIPISTQHRQRAERDRRGLDLFRNRLLPAWRGFPRLAAGALLCLMLMVLLSMGWIR